jgi:hypothetical protein
MSVRRRAWKTRTGEVREAWIVDYSDQLGDRHIKTFRRKRDADAWHARVAVDVTAGVHTADSRSITVTEAGRLWIESGEARRLERSTLEAYRQHLDLHITPLIGTTRLAHLTVPLVRAFEDRLRTDRSPARSAGFWYRSRLSSATHKNAAWSRRTWGAICAAAA